MKKLKKFFFIFGEKSHNAEKTERRNPLGFSNIHSVAIHQKNAGGPFEEKISKKKFRKKMSRSAEKKLKGGTLWSRPVWYVTRRNR